MIIFSTKIKLVPCDTLITNSLSCIPLCDYGRVPTTILVVDVTTFHTCGMDWMKNQLMLATFNDIQIHPMTFDLVVFATCNMCLQLHNWLN
jgi:hypothetical protein